MRPILLTAILVTAFAGCAVDTTPDSNEPPTEQARPDRVKLGKADHLDGSCTDQCGGKSTGACWCDDQCITYGDCCDDLAEECGMDECRDDGQGCHAGSVCEIAPDIVCITFPCPSPPNTCVQAPPPGDKECGGFLGLTCDEDEYCDYDDEFPHPCGNADGPGICKKRPEACIEIYAPACGCDGETYGNSCKANGAGVDISKLGACGNTEPSCQGSCGFEADGCWCDDLCTQYGDCCGDYEAICAE